MKHQGMSMIHLVNLWKEQVKLTSGIEKQLTPKELGQLKMMRSKLGHLTSEVIERTLGNWPQFCNEAKLSAGLPSSPPSPHIGFLLTHAYVAINLMHEIAKNKGTKSPDDIYFIEEVDCAIEEQKIEAAAWAACQESVESSSPVE
jgi:hypothetical protein